MGGRASASAPLRGALLHAGLVGTAALLPCLALVLVCTGDAVAEGGTDGAAARSLQAQAKALGDFTREAARDIRPTWTEEEREYVATSVELALLGATTEPVSEEMLAALKSAVTHHLDSNYSRPAPETLEYHRKILAWLFKDTVETEPVAPEEAAKLEAQFLELLSWLRAPMQEALGLEDGAVQEALAYGRRQWVREGIRQPYRRFDRKPLTAQAMQEARNILRQEIEAAKTRIEKLEAEGTPEVVLDMLTREAVKKVPYRGLYSVVKQLCGWRVPPVALSADRARSGKAQRAYTQAWFAAPCFDCVRFMLDALLAGGEVAVFPPGMNH